MFVVGIVGCGGSGSVVGKYYHDAEEEFYLELRKDGTVWTNLNYYDDDQTAVELGTYKTSGKNITVIFTDNEYSDPMTLKGTVEGKKLTLYPVDDKDDVEVFNKK